jgi:hypothetical protein
MIGSRSLSNGLPEDPYSSGCMGVDTLDLPAARTTLIALRAAVPRPEDLIVPGVLLLPEAAPLTLDQGVERLAAKPKPASCVAFVALGCLAVGAWELTGSALQAHVQTARTEGDWIDGWLGRDTPGRVLVRGSTDHFTLSVTEFRTWYSLYQLPFVDWAAEAPDSEARSRGAIAVVSFRAPLGGVRARRILGTQTP